MSQNDEVISIDDDLNSTDIKPTLSRSFLLGITGLLAIAAGLVGTVLVTGWYNVERYVALGPWGDFAAGLLNPLLTFLTFAGVLMTIALQRMELSLTRDEMARSTEALQVQGKTLEKQNFESTFFEMLKLHNSIVNAIDLRDSETTDVTTGRDCFRVFYTRLTKAYRANQEKGKGKHSDLDILLASYVVFWRDAQPELGHYFRFLFNFVRFVDESERPERFYMKLLRSQLSDQELLILYYNTLTEQGHKFEYYAVRHALFDNLPVVRLLKPAHANLLPRAAFGDNPMITNPRRAAAQRRAKAAGEPTSRD